MPACKISPEEAKARYQAFVASPEWRESEARLGALERDGHRCRLCNSPERPEVHHRVYRWPWSSARVEDLTVLCSECHAAHGGFWTRRTARRIGLGFVVGLMVGLWLASPS